jgi:beta-lactamase regulating signal transducer with metallopeptidase domain
MKSELITYLVALTIASTLSMLVVLATRRGVRLVFGAAAAYSTWLLVPAAMLAVLLPAPSDLGSTIGVSIRIALFSTLSNAIDNPPGSSLHTVHPVDWTLWAIGTGCRPLCLYSLGFNALSSAV